MRGFGVDEFDSEGRYLEAQVGALSVVSLYLPSGSAGPQRQASKFRFLDAFTPHLAGLRRRRRHYILGGDWNIAHRPIDLKNWRSNQKNSGFLPEERAWMDQLFGAAGYVDAFREVRPGPELYTWWSNRGQARANNVGWRIDYQVVSSSARRQGARRLHLPDEALLRSRAAHHGLRSLNVASATPTLAAAPRLREVLASPKMLAILVLAAASGFPNQITESALQAWLKDAGATNTTIGVMSYVALPYLLKFLWAPFIDRYPLPLLGRRRGWMLAMQVALAVSIALLAAAESRAFAGAGRPPARSRSYFSPRPRTSPSMPTGPTSSLPCERGLAAAAANLGYRPAAWLASACALIVAQYFGWRPAFLMLAGIMLCFCVATRARPGAAPPLTSRARCANRS